MNQLLLNLNKYFRKVIFPLRKFIELCVFKVFNISSIHKYKNFLKGQPIIIVGNGPSLNLTPLDEFRNISSIGMNKINLIFKKVKWRPSFIICTNGIVMKQNKAFFQNSSIPLILDFKAFFMKIRGVNTSYFFTQRKSDFSLDFTESVGWGYTVTYQALQFAYYLGANPIIILGVDHSFNVEKGEKITYQKNTKDDTNHFDPNYFGKGSIWGVPDLEGSERDYIEAREFFKKEGIKVYDATVSGKLQVFKKISIKEALKIVNKND